MNLKRLRKAEGLTQQALADSIGVNRVTIANWESGNNAPGPEMFDKLASTLGCAVGEFFVPPGHSERERKLADIQTAFLDVMEYTRNKLLEDLQRSEDKATIDHFNEEVARKIAPPEGKSG